MSYQNGNLHFKKYFSFRYKLNLQELLKDSFKKKSSPLLYTAGQLLQIDCRARLECAKEENFHLFVNDISATLIYAWLIIDENLTATLSN